VACQDCDWPGEGSKCLDNPICLIALLAVLILAAVAAWLSLDAVPPLNTGIRYNHFSKSADTSRTYGPGRYFVGPFCKFLLFPSDTQNIEFLHSTGLATEGQRYDPLHTRTKDGLGLHLQVSLQYQLQTAKLGRLYEKFNLQYQDVYVSTVRDTLIRAASEFSAQQLWKERPHFGNHMQAMVNQALQGLYAECWGLQLLLVDLPDSFEYTITQTQVQNQLMRTKEMEQVTRTIEAETGTIQSDYAKQEQVILADGHANYTVTTKEAHAHAQQNRIDNEAGVMHNISFELGFIGEDLVYYQRYGALDDLEDSRLFYGFGGAAPMLVSSSP